MELELEVWKQFRDTNYSVSTLGRVRNDKTGKILKLPNNHNYLCCKISIHGKFKLFRVHRIVAEVFIPNPNNLPVVNHIDGNKTNNIVFNLEWVTHSENSKHAVNLGLTPTLEGRKMSPKEYDEGVPGEIWKPYKYNYAVSNLGRIKNIKTNLILKQHPDTTGYMHFHVHTGSRGERFSIAVHRAVAEVHIPNPNNLLVVNHKDGNKLNNKVGNLEWCTQSENIKHAVRTGLHKILNGTQNPRAKLTKEAVNFVRVNYIPRDKTFGTTALAKRFGVSRFTISKVIHGKTYKYD